MYFFVFFFSTTLILYKSLALNMAGVIPDWEWMWATTVCMLCGQHACEQPLSRHGAGSLWFMSLWSRGYSSTKKVLKAKGRARVRAGSGQAPREPSNPLLKGTLHPIAQAGTFYEVRFLHESCHYRILSGVILKEKNENSMLCCATLNIEDFLELSSISGNFGLMNEEWQQFIFQFACVSIDLNVF